MRRVQVTFRVNAQARQNVLCHLPQKAKPYERCWMSFSSLPEPELSRLIRALRALKYAVRQLERAEVSDEQQRQAVLLQVQLALSKAQAYMTALKASRAKRKPRKPRSSKHQYEYERRCELHRTLFDKLTELSEN
jgi:hypothetical protein